MKKYTMNVTGCVEDTKIDFRCGFDITVENGGNVENVGKSIQAAIDGMLAKAHKVEKSEDDE